MGHRRWGQLRPCHLFLLSQENRGFTGLIDFFPFPSLAVVFPRNHPALLTARTKSCSQQSPFSFGRTFANLGLKQGLHKLSLTIKFPGASNRVFQPFFFFFPSFFVQLLYYHHPKICLSSWQRWELQLWLPDSCWGVCGVGGSDPLGAASFVLRSPQKASAFQTKFLLGPGAFGEDAVWDLGEGAGVRGALLQGLFWGEKNISRRGFPSFGLWFPSKCPTHVQLLDPNPLISEFLPRISERFPGTSREAAPAPHFKDPKK